MKKVSILFLSLLVLVSCSKDDDNTNVDKSDAKAITAFVFAAADNDALTEDIKAEIDEGEKTIAATVPSGTDVKVLKPTLTVSEKAKTSPDNKAAKDFTEAVEYTVTAEDGSEAKYAVTVSVGKSSAKEITSFVFLAADNEALSEDVEAEIDEEQKTITAEMPIGTVTTSLMPSIVVSEGSTVSPDNGVAKDFSTKVEYKVTAQDGSTLVYTITVNVALTDRQVLIELYNANPDNTLAWDLDDEDISNWENVTVKNGRVVGLRFFNGFNDAPPFGGKNLTTLPASIRYLTKLESLSVQQNRLTSVPASIGNLKNLKVLNLVANSLSEIPAEIGNLTNLSELFISINRLTSLPKEIGNLKNLSYLELYKNDFTEVPGAINELNGLTLLNLSENEIDSLNPEFFNLENLTYLDLSENALTSIPSEIGNLGVLRTLFLDNNKLTNLPSEMAGLTQLQYLYIHRNQITVIPSEICDLPKLEGIIKDDTAECEQ
ncbi:leucine-rich repeat domain-containing protein [Flagellimonas sp. HMM57]|uniref:leucine-rich repeat domain-containing protein n=1 Tax=unclassified Flagellimonas TaxID=2644544 RepID=UPI0013D2EA51|nr:MULTISPECIES: leucine-rich repeat domain-containing protein [unclassified Flagellimonas]UII77378.1 leucine-rich repeat domain-containing protein [Flagellimonas sp. HMM57]